MPNSARRLCQNGGCRLGWRRGARCRAVSLLQKQFDGIALFLIQAAQLVFYIVAGLLTEIEQVFAFDVQLPGKLVNANLLTLQAALLYR